MRLRLPELDDNMAEGYVLKPADDWPDRFRDRPIVTVKQPAFAEEARYRGSPPYSPPVESVAGVPAWLFVEAATPLTPAPAAVVGKIGPSGDPETVAGEIIADVAEEIVTQIGGWGSAISRIRCDPRGGSGAV